MTTHDWLAACSLALAVISVIVIPLFVLFFRIGRSSAVVDQHGVDIKSLKEKTDTHGNDLSGLMAGFTALRDLADEIRKDVKSLLTGRRGRGSPE